METKEKEQSGTPQPVEEKKEPSAQATPSPQIETFTKEDVDRIAKEAAQKASFETFKKLNPKLAQLGDENKKLREQAQQGQTPLSNRLLKELLDVQSANLGDVDPAAQTRIARLRAELEAEEAKQAQVSRYQEQQVISNQEKEKLVQKITEAGENPEDEKFESVFDAWEYARDVNGKFDKAYTRLDRLLSKKPPTPEVKTETKVEETEEQKLEKYGREYAKKMGWLKTDISSPSGGGTGKITVEQVKGMSTEEIVRHAKEISKLPLTM